MSATDERNADGPSAAVDATTSSSGTKNATNPARINRAREKQALHDLNNRLVSLIARGQHLEAENAMLAQELHSREEVTAREVGRVKALFEPELDVLRFTLDHEAQEKGRLEMENRRKNLEVTELKAK